MLHGFFQLYRERFGSMPSGEDNAQFLNALRGRNPAALGIFPLAHPRLDSTGQLLDRWGTPYFFHALSRDHIQIRSAGPDRSFYTEDDVVYPRNR